MSQCKSCLGEIDWGNWDGRWVPLEPIESHDDLDRTFVDENGIARADHRDRHKKGSSGVNVTRLTNKIPAAIATGEPDVINKVAEKRAKKKATSKRENATG